jgi:hypothetical protein
MHEDKEMMARRIGQRGREEVELHLLAVTTPESLARASCGQGAPQRPQEGVLGRRGERCELREWLESSFYRRGRQQEGDVGGVHGQWVARVDVRGDVGGWGQGDITLETSAGGVGRAGREGVEREAPRVAALVGFPLWLRRVSVFGLL